MEPLAIFLLGTVTGVGGFVFALFLEHAVCDGCQLRQRRVEDWWVKHHGMQNIKLRLCPECRVECLTTEHLLPRGLQVLLDEPPARRLLTNAERKRLMDPTPLSAEERDRERSADRAALMSQRLRNGCTCDYGRPCERRCPENPQT